VTILAGVAALPIAAPTTERCTCGQHRDPLEHTAFLIRELMREWHVETPQQIHSDEIDEGGYLAFHPDFIAYVDRPCLKPGCFNPRCNHGMRSLHPDSRVRVSRAFRRLRVEAPREFDALYLVCRHQFTIDDVARKMTERSMALGWGTNYSRTDIMVLIVSGAHKVEQWW
jgi:hypothetical protein